jgi:hypothetical protein
MDFWTAERIDQLMAMVVEGKTFPQIAHALGTTRNAALGKYHRIKVRRGHVPKPRKAVLEGMGSAPRAFDRDTVAKRQYTPSRKLPDVSKTGIGFLLPAIPAPAPRTGPAKGILDVTGCKWPVAEDASLIGGQAFCDATKKDNSPYCAHHAARAFTPVRTVPKSIGVIGLRFERRAA